ncbi:MAG: hypothetical protein B9S32_10115 [Verrucomicrobia bacterium Tous-C9LFEB]|nr:MAG: hypothetical protein B9S32_10115 [Verrucomicrobia bacterium Tous-C9LFEB]
MAKEPRIILMVEDNDDDAFITSRAFNSAQVDVTIKRAEDGQSAMDYLEGGGVYADRKTYPLPDIVLLDLKLPRKSGLEVLQWVRKHPTLHPMVILVLTSSSERADVEAAYQLHVNAYVVKPTSINHMVDIARHIHSFWLNTAVVLRPTFVFPFILTAARLI